MSRPGKSSSLQKAVQFFKSILQCETETDVVLFDKISNSICKEQSEV